MPAERDLQLIDTGTYRYMSDGEIHYLWHFMLGSIMDPYIRSEVRKSWGFCQRHTIAWLIIEAAFHSSYMHGPSILLSDLTERALRCFQYKLPTAVAMRLKNRKPCFICNLGYNLESIGYARQEILDRGRNTRWILEFARETEPFWRKNICPECSGSKPDGGVLCRNHLVQSIKNNGLSSLNRESDFLNLLSNQLNDFVRSFRWEYRDTETTESKASLITAACWLSGWTEFLDFYNSRG